jgi:dihydropyrimidinase
MRRRATGSERRLDEAEGRSLLVRGGRVVTPAGILVADVVASGGRVVALVEAGGKLSTTVQNEVGTDVIDATGCFVVPGGIDPHCHLMEDVTAGTRAAALGGTTTVLSFTNPGEGEDDVECLRRNRAWLEREGACVDVGLHAMLYAPDSASPERLAVLQEEGAASVKVFLAYAELGIMWSATGLFDLMRMAAAGDIVVQVHCEQGDVIDRLVDEAGAKGETGPRVFASTRPPETEAISVAFVLGAAAITGATCYLVHLSSHEALEQVRLSRRTLRRHVVAEACLPHLMLDESLYERADFERFLVAPPLRSFPHKEALWEALRDGTLDTVGSDHSQVRERTVSSLDPDGSGYWYGIAGVGPRLPLVLSRGLERGIPLERLMDVTSTGPARAFGHFPKKGLIAAGSDADMVVFDPSATTTIDETTFDDGTGDSVYAGERFAGAIRHVVLRGKRIVSEGRYIADSPAGRYLPLT